MAWVWTVEVALVVDVLVADALETAVPVEVVQAAAVQTLRLAATTQAPRDPSEVLGVALEVASR
jgi:hypothetical protein